MRTMIAVLLIALAALAAAEEPAKEVKQDDVPRAR